MGSQVLTCLSLRVCDDGLSREEPPTADVAPADPVAEARVADPSVGAVQDCGCFGRVDEVFRCRGWRLWLWRTTFGSAHGTLKSVVGGQKPVRAWFLDESVARDEVANGEKCPSNVGIGEVADRRGPTDLVLVCGHFGLAIRQAVRRRSRGSSRATLWTPMHSGPHGVSSALACRAWPAVSQ